MKKILCCLLTALLAVTVMAALPTSAFAATEGTCGDGVTYSYDTETKTLTIKKTDDEGCTGAMTDYASYTKSQFYADTTIRNNCESVVIGEGVTTIGKFAFNRLSKLASVTLPSTLTEIHDTAFQLCTSLTNTGFLREGVVSIGANAFNQCTGLTSVHLPDSLVTLGASVFTRDTAIAEVTLGSGIQTIGQAAFDGLFNVTELVIPASVRTIGNYAFRGWSSCTSLTINEGVTSIGEAAFGSMQVTEFTIPATLTNIGSDAFSGFNVLAAYEVAEGNTAYCAADGILYTADKKTLIDCPLGKTGEVAIDPACETVGIQSFSGCTHVTGVTFPASVTSIKNSAFDGSGLTSVTVPETVTEIEFSAFQYCESLTTAEINALIDALPSYLFNGCSGLTSVTLGSNVRGYGENAFQGCTSLTSVTQIPGITEIPSYCFSGCSSLNGFEIPATVTTIGSEAFKGCASLENIVLPEGLASLGSSAFFGCLKLYEVTVPEGIVNLPNALFQYCSNLRVVTILGDLTQNADPYMPCVAYGVFGQCTSLEKIYVKGPAPDPKKINSYAFNNASTSVEVHFLPSHPEWGSTRSFDVGGMEYTYICDVAEVISVDIRERGTTDVKRDLRFMVRLSAYEPYTVERRYVVFTNLSNDISITLECPNTFSTDPDGAYQDFTAILRSIPQRHYDKVISAQAFIEVRSKEYTGTVESNKLAASINDLLDPD